MRKINLNEPPTRLTILIYGPTKSGKTEWIGTFPKLLVLAAGSESGWDTFQSMPAERLYDGKTLPEVWAIDHVAGAMAATDGIRG